MTAPFIDVGCSESEVFEPTQEIKDAFEEASQIVSLGPLPEKLLEKNEVQYEQY